MKLKFEKLDKKGIDLINIFRKNTKALGSEFSYTAFLSWYENVEIAFCDDTLFLRGCYDGICVYFPPLTNGDINHALLCLPEDITVNFFTVDMVSKLDAKLFDAVSIRDNAEYIYNSSDLINLAGKRYHSKRNHIAKFNSLYKYTFTEYEESDCEDVISLMNSWFKSHDDGSIQKCEETTNKECKMLKFWLENHKQLGLFANVLRVEDELAGLSIGEISPSGVGIVMFEKANIKFEGIYSALTNLFSKEHYSDIEFINRQEDMGLDGLRRAKLSLNPAIILEKFAVSRRKVISLENSNCIETRRLNSDDFDLTKKFFDDEVEKLADKKFFLKYTDDELKSILNGNGFFCGGFIDEKLVATCAVDFDDNYGKILKNAVFSSENELNDEFKDLQFYEYSGIFVADGYRKMGLANRVCSEVLEYAKNHLSPCVLCSLVQFDNIASQSNLKKLDFHWAYRKAYKEYLFDYFLLKV
ncbi:MAG: GNAT family N-acetyltransferase [Clostridia bacterium]|nr:GNAT family N-acetyltransferase [Clostridia bacterium]